jgi:hypothetical protein
MPDAEAFRHLLHHHPELIDTSDIGTSGREGIVGSRTGRPGMRDADVIVTNMSDANFSSRLCG